MKSVQSFVISVFFGALLLFIILNIVVSQYFPSFLYTFTLEQSTGVVEYYRRARALSVFPKMFSQVQDQYADMYDFITDLDAKRRAKIEAYEAQLEINTSSRDLHLLLAQLYQQEGNMERAQYHLHQAQTIDPQVTPFQTE